jgi:transcriptional regulator GlxA family with amidase domain
MMSMHAQIVLFDGFAFLDVIAPFEVLVAGSYFVESDLVVEFVSAEGARSVVSGTEGVALKASSALDPSKPGYVIVPGASGPMEGDPDDGVETIPVLLARFGQTEAAPLMQKALAHPDITVATVCGGSLALAMAGLLEGRNAVTNILGMDALEATGTNTIRARVVDDGDLITAGGVTSGLDLALYLLERSYGPKVAVAVEELFEYERRGTVWTTGGHDPVAILAKRQGRIS